MEKLLKEEEFFKNKNKEIEAGIIFFVNLYKEEREFLIKNNSNGNNEKKIKSLKKWEKIISNNDILYNIIENNWKEIKIKNFFKETKICYEIFEEYIINKEIENAKKYVNNTNRANDYLSNFVKGENSLFFHNLPLDLNNLPPLDDDLTNVELNNTKRELLLINKDKIKGVDILLNYQEEENDIYLFFIRNIEQYFIRKRSFLMINNDYNKNKLEIFCKKFNEKQILEIKESKEKDFLQICITKNNNDIVEKIIKKFFSFFITIIHSVEIHSNYKEKNFFISDQFEEEELEKFVDEENFDYESGDLIDFRKANKEIFLKDLKTIEENRTIIKNFIDELYFKYEDKIIEIKKIEEKEKREEKYEKKYLNSCSAIEEFKISFLEDKLNENELTIFFPSFIKALSNCVKKWNMITNLFDNQINI